jgi:hypothetical protein
VSSDPFAAFDDLTERVRDYPGKREPVNRSIPRPVVKETTWDASPRHYKVQGIDTEFFTVGHMALAVNRSARTVRYWERHKILPPATFRAPKPQKGAVKQVGDRLYSRAQIEAVVAVAAEEGVLGGKAPTPSFTAKVHRAWLALQKGT